MAAISIHNVALYFGCFLIRFTFASSKSLLIPQHPLHPPPVDQSFFEFWLVAGDDLTMSRILPQGDGKARQMFAYDLYRGILAPKNCASGGIGPIDIDDIVSPLAASGLPTADGGPSRVYKAVNNSLPGPTLVVRAGAEVVVHVTNAFMDESFTLHWHGLTQLLNNWHDGVGRITQCPIRPGETFDYRFWAEALPGTYFYHEHSNTMRGDGLFGALIVMEAPIKATENTEYVNNTDKSAPNDQSNNALTRNSHDITSNNIINKYNISNMVSHTVPSCPIHYAMSLFDWFPVSAGTLFQRGQWTTNSFSISPHGGCKRRVRAPDGARIGEFEFGSILVNGRGWADLDQVEALPLHSLPLSSYSVKPGGSYHFHVINAASNIPIMVSIETHRLMIISTDGYPVKPMLVDYLIVSPGERFDFLVNATNHPKKKYYKLTAMSLGMRDFNTGEEMQQLQYTYAVLDFENFTAATAADREPTGKERLFAGCGRPRCLVLNCPFAEFNGYESVTKCLPITSLQSGLDAVVKNIVYNETDFANDRSEPNDVETLPKVPGIRRTFINLWTNNMFSGRQNVFPLAPPGLIPESRQAEIMSVCPAVCSRPPCICSNQAEFDLNEVVDLVLFSRSTLSPLSANGGMPDSYAHPIHIHGLHFQVLKLVYPSYSPQTGFLQEFNQDVDCASSAEPDCNQPTGFTKSSRIDEQLDAINETTLKWVAKDTIFVPVGGYSVVRFRTLNPGMWILHCHMMDHHLNGMLAMFSIGTRAHLPPLPNNFPRCYSYEPSINSSEGWKFAKNQISAGNLASQNSFIQKQAVDNVDTTSTPSAGSYVTTIVVSVVASLLGGGLIGLLAGYKLNKILKRSVDYDEVAMREPLLE